jgi:hypothetical protein
VKSITKIPAQDGDLLSARGANDTGVRDDIEGRFDELLSDEAIFLLARNILAKSGFVPIGELAIPSKA